MNSTPQDQTTSQPNLDSAPASLRPDTGRHPLHVGYLVMGLAFLGLVAIWGAVEWDFVSTKDVRWLLPLPWVFAGAAGLLAVVFSGRSRSSAPPAYSPPPTDTTNNLTANPTTGQDKELS
jgi:hypothetical protein